MKKQLSNSKFIFNYPDMADFIFEDTISAQIEIAKYIEEKNFSYGVISISHELKDIFKDTNINNIEIQKSIIDYIAALPKDYDFVDNELHAYELDEIREKRKIHLMIPKIILHL